MEVKTTLGNKDVQITEVTPENYILPKGEEHLFHALIEVKKFDPNTAKRQSVPRIQKFGKKTFESGGVHDNLKRQGYTVDILHDPNAWLEANKKLSEEQQLENQRIEQENQRIALEEQEKMEEQLRLEKEKADQKKFDDAIAKALAGQQEAIQKAIDEGIKKGLAAQQKATPAPEAKTTGTEQTKTTANTGDAAKTTGTTTNK
jgi:hypothetical protein